MTREFPDSRSAQNFILEMLCKGYVLKGEPLHKGTMISVTLEKTS